MESIEQDICSSSPCPGISQEIACSPLCHPDSSRNSPHLLLSSIFTSPQLNYVCTYDIHILINPRRRCFISSIASYNNMPPAKVHTRTIVPTTKGAWSKGRGEEATFFLVAEALAPDATAVTDPDPGVAEPVDVPLPPASWEPPPERPGPVPAPLVIYYSKCQIMHGYHWF
jgi:hypothetical protein